MASDGYILRVDLLEGRGFPEEHRAPLVVSAVFAGETKTTPASAPAPSGVNGLIKWSCSLSWSVSRDAMRRAQAAGAAHCKLTVLRDDGTCLGWTVIGFRAAKLQAQYRLNAIGVAFMCRVLGSDRLWATLFCVWMCVRLRMWVQQAANCVM
jgi:hypothetical protein